MDQRVTYQFDEGIATIAMDDGKANALSPAMQSEINAALDQAEADNAIVVLAGRPGVFCGGFDLNVLRGGGQDAIGMLSGGFELSARLLSFPRPVVIACTGHAIAMGLFIVLSGDLRIGATGDFRLVANEVAIGLTMPEAAIEICRQRLTPAAFTQAVLLAAPFSPVTAVPAGILDQVAEPLALMPAALAAAGQLTALDANAHRESKLRARRATLDAMRAAMDADARALAGSG